MCSPAVAAQAESPAELRAELRRAAQCSAALRPNPTNSSLGDRETVTLRVVLSPPGADGDLGDSGNRISRRSSRSPQQPRRQQLRSALRMGREGGHGGRKLRLPATELKDGQQSIASRLPRPAARSVPKAKAGAHLAGEPSGAEDEDAAIEGDLFESEAEHCLRPVVPNGALRGFVARVARAVRKDCRLPHLQPNCAKLLAHTGRLLGLLGGQRPAAQCAPVGNSSVGTEGRRSGGEVGQSPGDPAGDGSGTPMGWQWGRLLRPCGFLSFCPRGPQRTAPAGGSSWRCRCVSSSPLTSLPFVSSRWARRSPQPSVGGRVHICPPHSIRGRRGGCGADIPHCTAQLAVPHPELRLTAFLPRLLWGRHHSLPQPHIPPAPHPPSPTAPPATLSSAAAPAAPRSPPLRSACPHSPTLQHVSSTS